jgi:hypothetical protein
MLGFSIILVGTGCVTGVLRLRKEHAATGTTPLARTMQDTSSVG